MAKRRRSITLTALIFTALASVSTLSHAREGYDPFDGVEHATITVNGEDIRFPIGLDESGQSRKMDVYILKKALGGDKDAMDMFMDGKEERWFFIGRETPLWLRVTKEGCKIVKP